MDLKNQLKQYFYERAPNRIRLEHLRHRFNNENFQNLYKYLDELIKEGFIECKDEPSSGTISHIPIRTTYQIKSEHIGQHPIETDISIGDLRIPRMIDKVSTVIAEDVNVIYEYFDKVTEYKIEKLKEANQNQLKDFWASLITIFGIFVTIFSLINIAQRQALFSVNDMSKEELLLQSLYNIVPLTSVLIIFLVILVIILKK